MTGLLSFRPLVDTIRTNCHQEVLSFYPIISNIQGFLARGQTYGAV